MDDKKETNVGAFIKKCRLMKGYTLDDVSKLIDVSAASISRWESGEIANMRRDKISILAKVLGVSPLAILDGPESLQIHKESYLQPVVGEDIKAIPKIGTIACGTPILAQENIEGYEYVEPSMDADFALTCKGDSMQDAGIKDGYTVFIKQTADVDDGVIAAVLIDDEATLKRVYHTDDGVILMPANKNYKPIVITADSKKAVRILGKAVATKGSI